MLPRSGRLGRLTVDPISALGAIHHVTSTSPCSVLQRVYAAWPTNLSLPPPTILDLACILPLNHAPRGWTPFRFQILQINSFQRFLNRSSSGAPSSPARPSLYARIPPACQRISINSLVTSSTISCVPSTRRSAGTRMSSTKLTRSSDCLCLEPSLVV